MSEAQIQQSVPEVSATPETKPAPPVGVTVNKRAVLVKDQMVEMPEKDQIRQA